MDDKKMALMWQMMQGLGNNPEQSNIDYGVNQGDTGLRDSLLSIRPMLSLKQQKIIDLMIKFNEIKELMGEIHQSSGHKS